MTAAIDCSTPIRVTQVRMTRTGISGPKDLYAAKKLVL